LPKVILPRSFVHRRHRSHTCAICKAPYDFVPISLYAKRDVGVWILPPLPTSFPSGVCRANGWIGVRASVLLVAWRERHFAHATPQSQFTEHHDHVERRTPRASRSGRGFADRCRPRAVLRGLAEPRAEERDAHAGARRLVCVVPAWRVMIGLCLMPTFRGFWYSRARTQPSFRSGIDFRRWASTRGRLWSLDCACQRAHERKLVVAE